MKIDRKVFENQLLPDQIKKGIRDLYDERDTLQASVVSSQRRILELELEVKRLRSALEKTKERYWERAYDGSGNVKALSVNEFSKEVNDALSTPPPALAEAYVRLRDAVETMVKGVSPDTVQAVGRALDEVERREKGE